MPLRDDIPLATPAPDAAPAPPLSGLSCEQRLTELQRLGGIGDWEYDLRSGAIYWSSQVYRLFERDERLGPPGYQENMAYYPPRDRAVLLACVEQAATQGRSFSELELRIELPGGRVAHQRSAIVPVRDAGGAIIGLRGIVEDITARKHVEEQLREREASYRHIVETASEGIWQLDAQWRTTFVNRHMSQMLGYEPEEMLGRHAFEFMDETAAHEAAKRFKDREGGAASVHDFRLRHRSGADVWVMISSRPVFDDQGRFAGSLAMMTDITARRRAEEALRASEEMLRGVIQAAPQFITLIDPDLRITWINRVLPSLSFEDVLGHCVLEFMAPEYRQDVRRRLDRVLSEGVNETYECDGLNAVGDYCWYRVHAGPLRSGEKIVGAVAVTADITEQRMAELAVRESERRLREIVERLPVGAVYVCGQQLAVNRAAEAITGYSGAELSDVATWFARLHGQERGDAAMYRGQHRQVTLRRRDASMRQVEVSTYGLEGGEVWLLSDVTEQRRLAERDRQQQAELQHTSRLMTAGEFASGIAHELNQPLGAIANFAEACLRLLAGVPGVPPEPMQMLRDIASESVRAGKVVHHLRQLIQKREPRREPVDLCEVVHSAVRLIEPELRAQAIELVVEMQGPSLPMLADGVQLMQVILNLVRNAIEAMEDSPPPRRITVACHREFTRAQICVTDTGPGFPGAAPEQLFEPFYTTKSQGLGIGLHICRSVIDAHGGRIWCDPLAGGGARFCFQLPAKPEA